MVLKPHDLVQIRGIDELIFTQPFPDWAVNSLAKNPFVVVRRAEPYNGCIPVGIRGDNRGQRFAAWLSAKQPFDVVTPYSLADPSKWKALYISSFPPAIDCLLRIKPILDQSGYDWGPTGSTGFELTTGSMVLKASSDLDLVLDMPDTINFQLAKKLLCVLQLRATVRLDIQLNTIAGGVALQELVSYNTVLVKTTKGPVLKKANDIWDTDCVIFDNFFE